MVTAPTPRAVDLLADRGFLGNARAISCGIDLAHYATRRTVGGTDISVLFVGRLDREKNVGELLRAVAAVPAARAEIVGDGSCRKALADEAERLGVAGRVRFRGFVGDEDLVRAYREADVFCMPGTAELQSLATMEAMAAGLPVVAADAMALPHLVRSGVTGFLYPPGDVERLAAALRWLGNGVTRALMGQAGRLAVARHALAGTLDAFEDVYRNRPGCPWHVGCSRADRSHPHAPGCCPRRPRRPARLAAELTFEVDDLLPLVDAAAMLSLLFVAGADLHLTPIGQAFTTADIRQSKKIFADQARDRAPLVRTVYKALAASADGTLRAGFFLDLLRRGFSTDDAQQQFDTAIDWGRYGELFDYDTDTGHITLDSAHWVALTAADRTSA